MQIEVLVYGLTAVAALISLFIRLRLRVLSAMAPRGRSARPPRVSGLVTAFTTCTVLGLIGWVSFLVLLGNSISGDSLVGVVGLFFLWLAALIGFRLVTRRTARGKHSAPNNSGKRSGYGLLIVLDLALFAIVCFFTWVYTTAAV